MLRPRIAVCTALLSIAVFAVAGCKPASKNDDANASPSTKAAAPQPAIAAEDPDAEDDYFEGPAGNHPPGTHLPQNPTEPGTPVGPNKYLPMRIESMDNRALYTYLRGLIYDKHPNNTQPSNRKCRLNTPGCTGDAQRTPMWIQPHMVMKNVDTASIPDEGLVVGRIFNNGRLIERRYGLPPGKNYWLVDREPVTRKLRSRFFQRTFDSAQPIEFVGDTKGFYQCTGHIDNNRQVSKAAWTTCAASLAHAGDKDKAILTDHEPGWLTCAQGCCIAGSALDGGP